MSKAPMGPTTVVMVYKDTEGGLEITSSKDEDAIEALTPERAHKAH